MCTTIIITILWCLIETPKRVFYSYTTVCSNLIYILFFIKHIKISRIDAVLVFLKVVIDPRYGMISYLAMVIGYISLNLFNNYIIVFLFCLGGSRFCLSSSIEEKISGFVLVHYQFVMIEFIIFENECNVNCIVTQLK